MRTHFRAEQLADPALAAAEKNLRACVHCGMCTATCPTYVLLGDERDGPRGRIGMMQQMLETGGAPSVETVTHLDRCLSCLGCRTACPSGVDYARLIDQSRLHIEQHYRRPLGDRLLRWIIATVLTRPSLTRIALGLSRLASPLTGLLPKRLRAMAQKARRLWFLPRKAGEGHHAKHGGRGGSFRPLRRLWRHSPRKRGENQILEAPPGVGERRIALLPGCVQQVIAPEIDEAVSRLLVRRGISLVPVNAGCCGALSHHLGREDEARTWAKRAIDAFERAGGTEAFDGIIITASGCAAHIADYPFLFRSEPEWQVRAPALVSQLMQLPDLISSTPPSTAAFAASVRVALQVPCSQQHGLRWPDASQALRAAGYEVLNIPEGHLCCGSAGSYSILQPEIASALRERKLSNILSLRPDVIATSNIGCLQHLSGPDAPPVVHFAALLDWAEGGPVPKALQARGQLMTSDRAPG